MKKITVLAFCLLTSLLNAQTLKSSQKITLAPGEKIIRITANTYAYAACTVKEPSDSDKEYSVVASYGRLGPFTTVTDLQFTDKGVAGFSARTTFGEWYVYEGLEKYGPYKSVKKMAAGTGSLSIVYIAQTDTFPFLYYNGKSTKIIADDFVLSEDGKNIVYVKTDASNKEKIVCWNAWTSPVVSEIMHLTISSNGMEIGFFTKTTPLYSFEKPNDNWTFSFIRKGINAKITVYEKEGYKYPGPVCFKTNAGGIYAVFSALRNDGVWEIRSETDKLLEETGEVGAISFFKDDMIYAAKPLNAIGPDSARFNILFKGSTAGGPYDEVRAIGTSVETLALVVRSAAYWYIVMQSGSYGPFTDIQLTDSWNAGMFAYNILSEKEWTGCIGTDSQVGLGCIVKSLGKAYGYAFCDGNTVHIYSMP